MQRALRARRRRKHRNPDRDGHYFTKAGPVTINRPDGTVAIEPALSPDELQAFVRDRSGVTPALRVKVFRRDGHQCRYCRTSDGPFEVDHVVPVSMGGSSRLRNLVVACRRCNSDKGANVWKPRPILRD